MENCARFKAARSARLPAEIAAGSAAQLHSERFPPLPAATSWTDPAFLTVPRSANNAWRHRRLAEQIDLSCGEMAANITLAVLSASIVVCARAEQWWRQWRTACQQPARSLLSCACDSLPSSIPMRAPPLPFFSPF